MIFSNFSKSISGTTILFKNSTGIEYVDFIKYFKDDSSGTFSKKEFRWSFDNKYWASWETLNQGNISSLKVNNNKYLFIEIRYVKSSLTSPANVNNFHIYYIETSSTQKETSITPDNTSENTTTTVTINTDSTSQSICSTADYVSKTFSGFTRTAAGNSILLKNINPLEYVKTIKFFKDNSSGTFLKKEFRWSFNNEYWSSWYSLNQGNITSVDTRSNKYLFLEFRYVKHSSTSPADVNSLTLTYLQLTATGGEPCIDTPGSTPSPTPIIRDYTKTDYVKTTVLNVTNADKLCGQTCDYYLWRPNHKGTQPISSITDLQTILNNITSSISDAITGADNVYGDGFGVFYDVSENDLLFKRLIAGEGVLLSDSSGIITIAADPSIIAKDPSINDLYNLYNTLGNDLNDISIYIDSQFIKIDASINDLYNNFNILDSSTIKGIINIGSGTGEIFKEINSNVAELRSIVSGNANVIIETVGDEIKISLDASVSGAPVWSDNDPVSADVGGISNGDDVSLGSNSIEILERILYEYKPPRILTFEPEVTYYEKWVTGYDVSVVGTFDNENFKKLRITDASLYVNGSGYGNSINYGSVESGSFAWHVIGPPLYEDRVYNVRLNNKVNSTYMDPYDISTAIYYVNPYYSGVVDDIINSSNITEGDITGLNKLIVPKQTNTINYDVSSNYMKIKFVYAYPQEYGDLRSIFDVKNDFNVTTSFDKTTVNITTSGGQIPYNVYIKNHWISFTPDVSVFKLIFNI